MLSGIIIFDIHGNHAVDKGIVKNAGNKIASVAKTSTSFPEASWKLYLLFLGLCMLLFGNSIRNKYSLDDEFVTHDNIQVMQGISAIPDIFTSRYVMDGEKAKYGYRPIVKVTFAIENELFGQNPHIGHLINILLYSWVCYVLFLFLRRILREHTAAFSFWIVVLFLFHPFHNEVVVSLKNRDALLSLLFGLLSMNAAIDALSGKSAWNYVKAILFIILAILSKTDVITFLFLIPFTAWFFDLTSLKKVLYFGVAIVIVFIIGKLTVGSVLSSVGNKRDFVYIENPLFFTEGWMPRITAAFASFWFYVSRLFFPFILLSYYGYNTIEILDWNAGSIAGVVLALGFLVYFVKGFRKKDPLYFGLFFFCVSISMFLNLVKPAVGIVAERFMFVPSIGFSIAVVTILYRFFKVSSTSEERIFPKGKVAVVLTISCSVFCVTGIARNSDWRDHLTLYEADAATNDKSAKLHALAGANLVQSVIRNKPEKNVSVDLIKKAVTHYERSIEIYPDYVTSLNNLGMIYQSYLRRYERASELYQKAVELDPDYPEAFANLGSVKLILKDTSGAIVALRRAVELNSGLTQAISNLSAALTRQKKYEEVLALNLNALKKGENSQLYMNIGRVYVHKGDTMTGVEYLAKASVLDPANVNLNKFLYSYYIMKGDVAKASDYKFRIQSGR